MIDNLIAIAKNCKNVEEALLKNGGISCPIRPYITPIGIELEITWMGLCYTKVLMPYHEIAVVANMEARSQHTLVHSIRKIVDNIIYGYN